MADWRVVSHKVGKERKGWPGRIVGVATHFLVARFPVFARKAHAVAHRFEQADLGKVLNRQRTP